MISDPEIEAMSKVHAALCDLEPPARLRVMRWIHEKFDLTELSSSQNGSKNINKPASRGSGADLNDSEEFTASLASYIRSKQADGNQTQRFLVTADWLRRRGQSLTSGIVAKALVDNQQSRLANPADCLNKNVSKGFCEKTKDGFFITPEGLRELGYP